MLEVEYTTSAWKTLRVAAVVLASKVCQVHLKLLEVLNEVLYVF